MFGVFGNEYFENRMSTHAMQTAWFHDDDNSNENGSISDREQIF